MQSDVVFAENKWRLLRYRGEKPTHAKPILLVPSLINRHYVLDLLPGRSVAEYLVQKGWDVHCIDWGTPGPEDRYLTFDDVCDKYLARAIRKTSKDGVHLLGYCLGGTLTAIHAAAHPERIASMCALAAPVDFSAKGLLEIWTQSKTFDVRAIADACGNIPWQLMQAAFHMLRPTLALSKTVHLVDKLIDRDDEFIDGFVALEKWGNDNVSLPGEWYVTYIEELYKKNAFANGTFVLGGKRVSIEDVTCPLQVVTFAHDNIVPEASAKALALRAGSKKKEHLALPGGHVGAVVSRNGAKRLWPAIDAFFDSADRGKKNQSLRSVSIER